MSRLLALFRARTPDHRGTIRDLLPANALNCTPQVQSPLPLKTRNRIYMTLNRTPGGSLATHHRHKPRPDRSTVLLLTLGCTLAAAAFVLNSTLAPRTFSGFTARGGSAIWILISGAFTAVPLAILGFTLALVSIRANAKRIAAAVANEGYCPSCAYPIAEIEPAPDGCTVCPECGGAWRIGASEQPDEPESSTSKSSN